MLATPHSAATITLGDRHRPTPEYAEVLDVHNRCSLHPALLRNAISPFYLGTLPDSGPRKWPLPVTQLLRVPVLLLLIGLLLVHSAFLSNP